MSHASRTPAGVQGCCVSIQGFRSCLAAPLATFLMALRAAKASVPDGVSSLDQVGVLGAEVFEAILVRHDLMSRWLKFQHDFLEA